MPRKATKRLGRRSTDGTNQDAEELQRVFLELVSDLFIVPAAIKKSREDFWLDQRSTLRTQAAAKALSRRRRVTNPVAPIRGRWRGSVAGGPEIFKVPGRFLNKVVDRLVQSIAPVVA
jgi:hypothetical protein